MDTSTGLRLSEAVLNTSIAEALGYTYAGLFRGHSMYHPPGQRTTVVPLPAYTQDWNVLMPLVLAYWGRLHWAMDIREVFSAVDAQRLLCEAVLADLRRPQT